MPRRELSNHLNRNFDIDYTVGPEGSDKLLQRCHGLRQMFNDVTTDDKIIHRLFGKIILRLPDVPNPHYWIHVVINYIALSLPFDKQLKQTSVSATEI